MLLYPLYRKYKPLLVENGQDETAHRKCRKVSYSNYGE